MGLFDIFKRRPPLPTELPEALIEAVYRRDGKALASLCAQHRNEIHRLFPVWRRLPEEWPRDPAALEKYSKGLSAVACYFESSGDSSLIQMLCDEADNPLVQWERDLTEAQSLMDGGHATEAITLLHAVLERTRGLRGHGLAAFKPRTLGSLGIAYFQAGDKVRAKEFTQQALEMCRQGGDDEGVRIYSDNIEYIHNAA